MLFANVVPVLQCSNQHTKETVYYVKCAYVPMTFCFQAKSRILIRLTSILKRIQSPNSTTISDLWKMILYIWLREPRCHQPTDQLDNQSADNDCDVPLRYYGE